MAAKYQILASLLRKELSRSQRQDSYQLPTELELCQRYQMSRQTVRHALQILMDEGLIQRRQGSGTFATCKSLSTQKMQVAVITTYLDDYIFPTLLHDMQNVLARRNYTTQVYVTENQVCREREFLAQLLEEPVGGILIEAAKSALPNTNVDLYQQLRRKGIPIVYFNAGHHTPVGIPSILDDNYGGGYQLAQHLIAQGHTSIGGIFKSDDLQGLERYQGVCCALQDAGYSLKDRRFCWYDTAARNRLLHQKDLGLLRQFIQDGWSDVSAVVCYNDEIAHLLIRQLLMLGKRIPQEIAVVSFDNSYYSQIGPIPITSLWHRQQRMGQVAAEELLNMIDGYPGQSRLLSWDLIPRKSSQGTTPLPETEP